MQILNLLDNVPANSEKTFSLNCKVLSFQDLNLDENVKIKINNYDSPISIYKNFVYHSEDENIFKLTVINENAEELNFDLLYGENFAVKNQKVIAVSQPVSSELIGEQAGDLNNISNQANSGIVLLNSINAKLNNIVPDSNEKIYNFYINYKGSPATPHLLIQEIDSNTGTVTEISDTEISVSGGKYNYEFNLSSLPAKPFMANTPYKIRINSYSKPTEVGSRMELITSFDNDFSNTNIFKISSGDRKDVSMYNISEEISGYYPTDYADDNYDFNIACKSEYLKTVVFDDVDEIWFRILNATEISNAEIRGGSARPLLLQLQVKRFS